MKRALTFFFHLLFCLSTFSQTTVIQKVKFTIDTNILNQWNYADVPLLSSDAKYALFNIKEQSRRNKAMILRSITSSWKMEFPAAKSGDITADNTHALIINSGDSLCLVTLGREETKFIPSVSAFRLIKQKNEEWLCYQRKKTNDLILYNFHSGKEKTYPGVTNYLFNNDATILILLQKTESTNNPLTATCVNIFNGKLIDIWKGSNASSFTFDKTGRQLAFVATMDSEKSIWLYRVGEEKAFMIASNQSKGIGSNLSIDGLNYGAVFSEDGKRLFINIKEKPVSKKPIGVMVNVWSFSDADLQEKQLQKAIASTNYIAVVNLDDKSVTQLQKEGDEVYTIIQENPDKSLIWVSNIAEPTWNRKSFICRGSTINGDRKQIGLSFKASMSPTGKYLIGKKTDGVDLYSCDLNTGELKNITTSIAGNYDNAYDPSPLFPNNKILRSLIWLKDESYVLINDRYDIWMVDPTAIHNPISITNYYGKNNHIAFTLPEIYMNVSGSKSVEMGEKVIVSGFNKETKEEGFYEIEIGTSSNPRLLTKGAYKFEIPYTSYNITELGKKRKKSFLIRRESATESPNYFLTSDFKIFNPVTSVFPEREYNWLTSELHNWQGLDGKNLQGVLYKPDNFDSLKKYPVVIHYYENMSDALNKYRRPYFVEDNINIPLFVAKGYLIFTPDIRSAPGKVGECAVNSVVSAANYLSKFSFVDSTHMGIQGHSFGSYATNYIVTHSNLFAAAMSSCGFSNIISSYDYIDHGESWGRYFEFGQGKIGKMLWEDPKAYIEGSPILSAHTITAPLLMMANKKDERNYGQLLELFMGLRRMGKRAWLLQYDNGFHGLNNKEDFEDFTVRIFQFFDHYLKDSACPKWMLNGIPAKLKGVDNGFQLIKEKAENGKWITPMEGNILTDEEKKKMEELKKKKPLTITID